MGWISALSLGFTAAVFFWVSSGEPSEPESDSPIAVPSPTPKPRPTPRDFPELGEPRAEPAPVPVVAALPPPVEPPPAAPRDAPPAAQPALADAPLEGTLIDGNVELSKRAFELAKMRATGAPGLAESERQYAEAVKAQAQQLEKAGYRKEDFESPDGGALLRDR